MIEFLAGLWKGLGDIAPVLLVAVVVKTGFWLHGKLPFGGRGR